MKIRKSFVTNSSSSSYICDICGREETGYDLSLSDVGMFQCEYSHTFCEHHKKNTNFDLRKYLTNKIINDLRQMLSDKSDRNNSDRAYWARRYLELLDDLKTKEEEDLMDFGEEEFDLRWEHPSELCPICSFETLTDKDGLQYFLKKYNMNRQDVLNELKNQFESYIDFMNYLK